MAKRQPYDASNPEHIAKAQEAVDERSRCFKEVLRTRDGRAFLYDLIFGDVCHILAPSLSMQRGDLTAFNEGARAVGCTLNDMAKTLDIDSYKLMLKENLQ